MTLTLEHQQLLNEAQRISCADWAASQGWQLRRVGVELIGPCPSCGGSDRFSINTVKNVWNCRHCETGGDVVWLIQHCEGLEFFPALERLTGRSAAEPVDPDRARALQHEAELKRRQQEDQAARYREKARKDGWAMLQAASRQAPWWDSIVADYLSIRGLATAAWPDDIRRAVKLFVLPDHPYVEKIDKQYVTLHRGPAMIAAVQQPDRRFGAAHQTWIDLSQPKGKAALPPDSEGRPRSPKKVRGIKQGGAVRLYTPDHPRRIIMGEGVETTLTPLVHAFEPDTAYWAGVDLGNMAGKAARNAANGIVYDQPDMADLTCFLPPDWCEELVYLAEGDEPDRHSIEKATRGLRRAMRLREAARRERPELPRLAAKLVPPPDEGGDLNAIAMSDDGDAQ